jgi:hypothetical protein
MYGRLARGISMATFLKRRRHCSFAVPAAASAAQRRCWTAGASCQLGCARALFPP